MKQGTSYRSEEDSLDRTWIEVPVLLVTPVLHVAVRMSGVDQTGSVSRRMSDEYTRKGRCSVDKTRCRHKCLSAEGIPKGVPK